MHEQQAMSMVEALVALADPALWARYCRLAGELAGHPVPSEPEFAVGSLEWQRRHDPAATGAAGGLSAWQEQAGRDRLRQRGAPPAFTGAPSPFGAYSQKAFDDLLASRRGPAPLLTAIDALERQLVEAFETAGRDGRLRASGFAGGAAIAIEPAWFGRVELDFAGDRLLLPDGSVVAGVRVELPPIARVAASVSGGRERRAHRMLREALLRLWERGAFTAGTGNERVLALVLHELQLSPSDPPYGFKSAETIRKLRKTLGMSL
jgi:hypothetical protein